MRGAGIEPASPITLRGGDSGVGWTSAGLASPIATVAIADLETRMDDICAVMDAVDSESAVVFGYLEGGPQVAGRSV